MPSRTGPVAWCDHEEQHRRKILRALHSIFRARNRLDVKNCTVPYDFYHPYDFLPVKPSEAAEGILYGTRTAWHGCILMVCMNNSQNSTGTPCGARAGIVRAPQGNLQCFSYPTGLVRGPCVTHKGAVRRPYGHARKLAQPELAKIPHGRRIWPYGPRTGCSRAV